MYSNSLSSSIANICLFKSEFFKLIIFVSCFQILDKLPWSLILHLLIFPKAVRIWQATAELTCGGMCCSIEVRLLHGPSGIHISILHQTAALFSNGDDRLLRETKQMRLLKEIMHETKQNCASIARGTSSELNGGSNMRVETVNCAPLCTQ